MRILGIDFTSSPSRRKPITCQHCLLEQGVLTAGELEKWSTFDEFERMLARPGPWISGIDFPFSQPRRFVETIGWPRTWSAYVGHARGLGRTGFRDALNAYRRGRRAGDKEHRRETDKAAGSVSPQKLYGVPVGLMFLEGAPRILDSGVSVAHLRRGDEKRIVVEAYPGVLAREIIGRCSYKSDTRSKQTKAQKDARVALLQGLKQSAPKRFGFKVRTSNGLCDDPGADDLDAMLCAVQAAWAWLHRDNAFGAPKRVDPTEGWIAHPGLRSDV